MEQNLKEECIKRLEIMEKVFGQHENCLKEFPINICIFIEVGQAMPDNNYFPLSIFNFPFNQNLILQKSYRY